MNSINRNNYESYLIDLVEGNLDAQTADELMMFLDDNPDIREEFEAFDNIILEPEPVTFAAKSHLKQQEIVPSGSINENNYETYFIAWYENDLSADERKDIELFIKKNPFLKKEFLVFAELTLKADKSIVFTEKELLHKHNKPIPLFWITSAAATIIVLISIVGLLKYDVWVKPSATNTGVAQIISADKQDKTGEKSLKVLPVISDSNMVAPTGRPKEVATTSNNLKSKKTTDKATYHSSSTDYAMLEEIPYTNPAIKLTSDEVYCRRIKYIRAMETSSPSKPVKQKSLAGKLIAGVFNKAKKSINPITQRNNNPEPLLAKVFDGGAHLLNNYTGTEANVTKYYDNRGKLVAYHFSGGNITFSKQFKSSNKKNGN